MTKFAAKKLRGQLKQLITQLQILWFSAKVTNYHMNELYYRLPS